MVDRKIRFFGVIICIAVITIPVFGAQSGVERLEGHLPDNVIAFVGTSGCDELAGPFAETILGRMWNDPSTQQFYLSIKDEIKRQMEIKGIDGFDPNLAAIVTELGKATLRRPIVIGSAIGTADDVKSVYAFAIVDAGPGKTRIANALTKLESLAEQDDIIEKLVGGMKMHAPSDDDAPLYWGWAGDRLVVAINDRQGLAVKYLKPLAKLARGSVLRKVPANGDAMAAYIDVAKLMKLWVMVVEQAAHVDDAEAKVFKTILDNLGLGQMNDFVVRCGFSGPDIVSDQLVELDSRNVGLFRHLGAVDMSMFELVDARAMRTGAVNFDVGGLYDSVLGIVKTVADSDFEYVERDIAEFETELNIKIRDGLLGSLSGEAAWYSLPAGVMMETPQGGGALILKLRNPELFTSSFNSIISFAAKQSNGMLQAGTQDYQGKVINNVAIAPLAMMQVMPSWTIVGDNAVIATNPALCRVALDMGQGKGESIVTTPGFAQMKSKLSGEVFSIEYCDSKSQFTQLMMMVQQFWPMAGMFAGQEGITLPFMLPQLGHIAADMQPGYSYSWFEPGAIRSHFKGVGVEQTMTSVGGTALAAGVLMPAMARVRQTAQRMVSATNLSGIGKACLVYANGFEGKLPPNFEALVKYADLPPQMLVSKRMPKDFEGPSYIYIPGQTTAMHPGNVVAYDNPDYIYDDVINVLFLDCHVAAISREQLEQELKATYDRLGREMPTRDKRISTVKQRYR